MIQGVLRNNKTILWIWLLSLFFIVVNTVFIYFGIVYLPFLPIVIFLVFLAFVRIDKIILLIVFSVPLSIPLSHFTKGLPIDVSLPAEPLLLLVMLIFLFKFLSGSRIDVRILRHPVSLAIFFNLSWILITTITSADFKVSLKFFIARLWFLTSFYFIAAVIFQKFRNIKSYLWMYIIGFSVVIVYTLVRHAGYGLGNQIMAHSMMKPFYNDHTSYGAILAILIPILLGLFLSIKKSKRYTRFFIVLLIAFFLFAIIFSYTRAAWVSLILALMVWIIIRLRIPFRVVLLLFAVSVGMFFAVRPQVLMRIEKNRQQSSGNISEHIKSISNVSTDQSNLERINRWNCAFRMWKDKPIFGFGPGVYQFKYAPYQMSDEKTEISTNFGNMGNAHSEYLGPLAESGVLGMLSFLLIIYTTIMTGLRVYFHSKRKAVKRLALAILLALITYYVHGFLNNFLDTDKVSALFWGLTAMLVAMDIFHKREKTATDQSIEK